MMELLRSPNALPDTVYFVLTEDGIMLKNWELPEGILENDALRFENLKRANHNNVSVKLDGQTYKLSSRTINGSNAVVVSLLNQSALFRNDELLLSSILVAAILSAFFVILLVFYYTRWVFDPLKRLSEIMKNIDNVDFAARFEVSGNNEITVLANQFNLMCERLGSLHEQVYYGMLKLKEAEIAILQSEINPHFLYNALDTIYWMSELNHTSQVSEMVHSLSKLFRIALQKTEDGMVPLSVEYEHISCYLTIQQVRYQDSISFEFYMQEGISDLKVLKLLLQPIVENAIIHGAESAGGGKVVINIYTEDDCIIYSVYNDGPYIDPDYIDRLLRNECAEGEGFAIRNVNDRIRLKFGGEFGLSLENQPKGGVLATIRQPMGR